MRKSTLIVGMLPVAAALMIAPASAKQQKAPVYGKLSYEEAWARCKQFVDQGQFSWDQSGQKYSRGKVCMQKFGYRI